MPTPLAIAENQCGENVVETGGPDGKSGNRVRYWDWWAKMTGQHDQGSSWCAAFVSWCFSHAGKQLNMGPDPKHPEKVPGFISCPKGEAWFKKNKRLTTIEHAHPGDVVFFHFAGEANVANHVGILEAIDHVHRTVTTIEGNTSPTNKGSQSNGGGVYRKVRSFSVVRSIGKAA